MRQRFFTAVFFAVGSWSIALAQVQTTSEIRGRVQDPSGAVLAGVTVTIRNQETGATREALTNDEGYYVFSSLKPGTYTVSAGLTGFKTAVITDREVLVAIPAQVNISLAIGALRDTVTVSAAGDELMNSATAELSTTIDQNLVKELPVETRNFFDLLALAPNTSSQSFGNGQLSFGAHTLKRVNAAGSFENSGVFTAGATDSASNVSIDGSNQQLALYNSPVNIQSSSTIKELRIQTASANAEFGNGSNAINVITKSGSNEFHGEVFWQHRNDNFDANGFFTNLAGRDLPEYKRNKFGASLGGPIMQNRLHFFGNYEGARLRQAVQGNAIVPTSAMRAGDFSQYRPLQPGGGLGPTPTIYNPYDYDPATGLRRPFPGNKIPVNLLDPGMQTLIKYTPLANTVIDGVPQYSGLAGTDMDDNQYTARIDWQKSRNATVYGRYTFAERGAVFGGLLPPLQGESNPSSTHTAVINWSQILKPTIVNDLSASYSRPRWGVGRPTNVPDVSQEMGLLNTSSLKGSPVLGALPDVSTGFSGFASWDPIQNTYQVKDDITFTRGRHTFKTGAHVTEKRLFFLQQSADKGLLYFDKVLSAACPVGNAACNTARIETGLDAGGMGFADYLLGTPYQAELELRAVYWHGHQRYYGFYFQDTWQVHPRLTLNLGLRYEHWRPWQLPRNNTVRYDFSGDGSLIFALKNPNDVLDPATDYGRNAPLNPGVPREGYRSSTRDFAPRVGFAYLLTHDTTIRAAGGIFYAGNVNTNQFSDAQSGGAPFVLRDTRQVARTEQLPQITIQGLFKSPSSTIPGPGENPRASPRALGDLEYPAPAVYQWSFSAQHRLNSNWAVNFDYLGSRTIHNQQYVDLNAPALPQGSLANVALDDRRRLPLWGRWLTWVNWGYANYHSATWGVNNREWHGLALMANFMWAKNLGTSQSPIGNDRNNFDFRAWDLWKGPAVITPARRFVSGWSYKLPIGSGKRFNLNGVVDTVFGGWIVSGITEFSTGPPATVSDFDNSGTGLGNQHADRIAGCDVNDAPRDRFQWFNTNCFVEPAFGTWGNSGQGIFYDPGINNWNTNLGKTFKIRESHQLEFRLEAYNTFNKTQWGGSTTNRSSASYGRISTTRPARQLQFTLFYNF